MSGVEMKTTSKQVKIKRLYISMLYGIWSFQLFSLFAVFWFLFGTFLFLVCFSFRIIIRNFATVETKTDSLWHE